MNYTNTRTGDYATSVEGAADVATRAPNQRMRLLAAFYYMDPLGAIPLGLTDEEAAYECQLTHTCYWKRCGELRRDGLIEYTGRTRVGRAGVHRRISVITEPGRAVFDNDEESTWPPRTR